MTVVDAVRSVDELSAEDMPEDIHVHQVHTKAHTNTHMYKIHMYKHTSMHTKHKHKQHIIHII